MCTCKTGPNLEGKRIRYKCWTGNPRRAKLVEVDIVLDTGQWWIRSDQGFLNRAFVHSVQVPLFTGMAWEPYP
jgi:hypothetical protein